ncbi:Rieske (2Fe-2S) protein [Modestobacter sp. NPDC049651]|uniref:QcrA and Rieske domain-containing protein n=1 Tax=unclassified Modestobacter TaxID=2643866 RepID=UPI0033F41566
MDPCFSRRSLLAAGGAGAGLLALAACSGEQVPELTGVGRGDRVVALADVPVGGAYEVSLNGRRVVVGRPTEDTAVAFDATCTHQGCRVRATDDGPLGCPCHGSEFDPGTGAVLRGPAEEPLAPVQVAVRGSDVVLA